MNLIHSPDGLQGDLVLGSLFIFLIAHVRIGWLYIEQFCFGDMQHFHYKTVLDFYMMIICAIPALYLMQIVFMEGSGPSLAFNHTKGWDEMASQTAFRPRVSGYQTVKWNDPAHNKFFAVVNFCYGVWHFNTAWRTLINMRKEDIMKQSIKHKVE